MPRGYFRHCLTPRLPSYWLWSLPYLPGHVPSLSPKRFSMFDVLPVSRKWAFMSEGCVSLCRKSGYLRYQKRTTPKRGKQNQSLQNTGSLSGFCADLSQWGQLQSVGKRQGVFRMQPPVSGLRFNRPPEPEGYAGQQEKMFCPNMLTVQRNRAK